MNIQYRPIIKSDDIEAVVDLHGLIWYTDDRDAIPSHVLIALQHAGSLLLGAFDDGRVVGFSLAFPGYASERRFLWSHATGVLPEYQGRGIGRRLKLLQKELALIQGYEHILWTYDPLQAGNANFNIHHLGCRCSTYHEDFYGQVNDGLNAGLPSDRFEVDWSLQPLQDSSRSMLEYESAPHMLLINESGMPVENKKYVLEEPVILVPIPGDINQLRSQQLPTALSWRMATRKAFKTLFEAKYEVCEFVAQGACTTLKSGYGAYILQKRL